MSLGKWPARRVLWVSVSWVVVTLLVFMVWGFRAVSAQTQLGNGLGAFSFGIVEVPVLIVGPPLLLMVLWFFLRAREASGESKRTF